nr:hypothetical protein [Tanacetum cinerariifolium]
PEVQGLCGVEWWRVAGSPGLWWEGRRIGKSGVTGIAGKKGG